MSRFLKPRPRKIPKSERVAAALHQKIAHERAQVQAIKRENHLRKLVDLTNRVFSDGTSIRDEP